MFKELRSDFGEVRDGVQRMITGFERGPHAKGCKILIINSDEFEVYSPGFICATRLEDDGSISLTATLSKLYFKPVVTASALYWESTQENSRRLSGTELAVIIFQYLIKGKQL